MFKSKQAHREENIGFQCSYELRKYKRNLNASSEEKAWEKEILRKSRSATIASTFHLEVPEVIPVFLLRITSW